MSSLETRFRYPKQFGNWLINAFKLRNVAQYQLVNLNTKEVKRMINHVEEFVEKISEVVNK